MRYRKKPVVIEAIQFTKEMAEGNALIPPGVQMGRRELAANGRFPEYMSDYKNNPSESLRSLAHYDHFHRHYVETLEGRMEVKIGDWIIRGVKGEFYPCKPDIFEQTYEPAE